ncbi:hypothetical protein [Methylobacterium ajmalii]|uniref:hypothetical protein n=1 Tax=Methylobacterium ajmalii TaxID=2738439 RepID=UPI002F3505D4
MSTETPGATPYGKTPIPRKYVIAASVAAFILIMFLPRDGSNESEQKTLQQIIDGQITKDLQVTSVYVPYIQRTLFYRIFADFGIADRKVRGTFMVKKKNGAGMTERCQLQDFDFTSGPSSSGQTVISIPGPDSLGLIMCANLSQ